MRVLRDLLCAMLGHRPPAGVNLELRRPGWTIYPCVRCRRTVTHEHD